MRLYCNNNLKTFYSDYFEYAQHVANYDFDAVHQYKTDAATAWGTKLLTNSRGKYQVSYDDCPGTTGFNLIPLNVPEAGTTVRAQLNGLTPGSALAAGDAGQVVDGDGNAKGNVSSYNTQSNQQENFRYGYIAVDKSGKSHYSDMFAGKSGEASFKVPANTAKLYFVVVGAPDTYNRQAWDDDETNDEQWPYEVSFENTDLLGNVTLPSGAPEDVIVKHSIDLNSASQDYPLHTYNLLGNGDMAKIAKAFRIQPSSIAAATVARKALPESGPAEGQVAIALTNPDGSLSYAYSANGTGFWIAADGSASTWGDGTVYFEYTASGYSLVIGHKPGASAAGTTYTIRPTMVYNKGGKLYKAVLEINMKF